MLSDGEKCGCKILDKFNITQPTLSHHMKILVDCGIVNDRKEGKRHYYSPVSYTHLTLPTNREV